MQIQYNRNSHDDGCFIFDGFKTYVRFSAQPDSPAAASAKVYSGPTITSSASPVSFTNINMLLSSCIEHHAECRQTLGGTPVDDHSQPPTLPTYILDLGHSNPPSPSIRLVAAEPGQRGHYAALSYCWGPSPAHHPPTTTSANLASHTAGIPLSTLPKTFQDAVTATRNLGLRYLWIDTLCTVQTTTTTTTSQAQHHRASTARTARTAYTHAQIVLAAADAATLADGLFRQYPPRPAATVPYLDAAGRAAGTMRAELRPHSRVLNPENGALLHECAWATPALVLARRVAFFAAAAVVWSCRRLPRTARCDDAVLDYFAARPTDWPRIVAAHSARRLAAPGERLGALEAVVEELALAGEKSGEGAQCVFGVWTDALAAQLMWSRRRAPGSLSRPPALREVAPSWSWASTEGGVSMMSEEQWRGGGGDGGLEVRAQLAIDGGGDGRRIRARGKLGRVELRVIEKPDPYLHPCDCEVRSLDDDDDGVVGLAASDVGFGEGVMTAVVWCLVVVFHPYNCPGGSYLTLYLRPRERGSDHYERIGHGMVVKKEWADRLVESELYLV
ncbi:hypothetical protein SLS58_002813 [Diplodia intermedia]|uniref:Heterokaryon incompatibility domain-containing protein n=1 Tax=Diplodia intermedia TaxID=856260 RepID=A0ABR3TXQ4_9PEZI